jgi:hypothetical protein
VSTRRGQYIDGNIRLAVHCDERQDQVGGSSRNEE